MKKLIVCAASESLLFCISLSLNLLGLMLTVPLLEHAIRYGVERYPRRFPFTLAIVLALAAQALLILHSWYLRLRKAEHKQIVLLVFLAEIIFFTLSLKALGLLLFSASSRIAIFSVLVSLLVWGLICLAGSIISFLLFPLLVLNERKAGLHYKICVGILGCFLAAAIPVLLGSSILS